VIKLGPDVAAAIQRATRAPLVPDRGSPIVLDRRGIERVLPHRDPFLLLDAVTHLDVEQGLVAARYDLVGARDTCRGHFPGHPVYPGVLQIEAIGQAGMLLRTIQQGQAGRLNHVLLTHILAASFHHPVPPAGTLEIGAMVVEDGLFVITIGQCLHDRRICAVAAVRGLTDGPAEMHGEAGLAADPAAWPTEEGS
jgi:3-hydroxyacyl-[acyl-carrier-protein] dehydratase